MRNRILGIIVMLLVWQAAAVGMAAAQTVQNVTVRIIGEEPLPDRVSGRIAASALTVGNKLLVGRPVTEVAQSLAEFEQVYIEILDRVLLGYSVQKVTISPGTTSRIVVMVQSWGDVVRDVTVELDPVGVSAESAKLLRSQLAPVEPDLARVIAGLPVDSMVWSGPVINNIIQELIRQQLPEFRSVAQIIPGKQTKIRITLIPEGPLVEEVRLSLRSHTVPNILLWGIRTEVEELVKAMRGLPVAFVEREKDWFSRQIQDKAAAHPHSRDYLLNIHTRIMADTSTNVILEAESKKYRVTAEGRLDLGQQENNATASLHAGKYVSKYDELFTEVTLMTGSMSWDFIVGWGRNFGSQTTAGVKYDINAHEHIFWLEQGIGPHWTLKLDHIPVHAEQDRYEWGLRYKLHDLLSLEYVVNREDNFLRLVGHL